MYFHHVYVTMIPLIINLKEKKVIVCGGGEVGARKASFFVQDCTVHVVSRSFSPLFDGLNIKRHTLDITTVSDEILSGIFNGAFLVIAATSDKRVNNRIGELCRSMEILFNNADGDPGDVIIPSKIQGESFVIAITTFGKSPAFSRYIRLQLEQQQVQFDRMVELQYRLRNLLKKTESQQERRSEILWAVLKDKEVWNNLSPDPNMAWNLIQERYLHG